MKKRNYFFLKFFFTFALIILGGFSGFGQSNDILINMTGQKIEWKIERKTMTRAEMQAILDKPAEQRFITLKVMVKLPTTFSGSNPVMASSMMDFTIYDPETGNPSVAVANHIAAVSAVPNLYFADGFTAYKSGDASMGILSVVPDIETQPCGGVGFSPAASSNINNIILTDGSFDVLFEYPVYINSVGSFDICMNPCRVSDCPGYPFTGGEKCPGTYGIITNFVQRGSGYRIVNQNTNRTDFFQTSGGVYDQLVNGENTYNKVICGGVTLLEGPEAELAMLDTACPATDFTFTATVKSVDPITVFKVEYKHPSGSWTQFSAGTDYYMSMLSNTATLKEAEITIYASAMNRASNWHNTQVRVISENANGKDTLNLTNWGNENTFA